METFMTFYDYYQIHMKQLLTQAFRAYGVIAVIVAAFTALWAVGVIDVALPTVGYAWFAVAAVGTVVAIGMAAKPAAVLEADASEARIETFEESSLTGLPLHGYMGALAMWAAVSFGWVLGGMSATGLSVVGYGWLIIAVYGAAIGIGIAANHRKDVTIAINPTETLDHDA